MLVALFVLTFFESIAATLLQRGVYFYTHENLGFSQSQNLWVAFGFVAIGITGFIVGTRIPSLFFWLPAALNVGAILLALRLPPQPLHLEHSHPERPAESELERMRALLGSARWSMTGSYALLYVLAP